VAKRIRISNAGRRAAMAKLWEQLPLDSEVSADRRESAHAACNVQQCEWLAVSDD
jgi:hypothetical protein